MQRTSITVLALLSVAFVGCAGVDEQSEGADESFATSAPEAPPAKDTTGAAVDEEPELREGSGGSLGVAADDPSTAGGAGGSSSGGSSGTPADPFAGAGPKPTGTCSVTKDANGFFVRNSGKGSYVAYVPKSYDGNSPMRAVVGLHGCGDNAMNFASWGVNPLATRATQTHIGISVGSETGNNKCWSMGGDDDKVLAAVDDLSKCFWIHQKKIVVGGFSSGGQLAYRVGMMKASRFAGILIENSTLSAGGNPTTLLGSAAWKIRVAHRAHTGDTVFPLATVRSDWTKIQAQSFPLATSEVPGGHDGNSEDWAGWLLPQSAGWVAP